MAKKKAVKNKNTGAKTIATDNKPNNNDFDFDLVRQQLFAAIEGLQFANLLKTTSVTYTQYDKENYRNYIQNPQRNEKSLRDMSQFLARVSMPYERLLRYISDIYSFYWNLTPKIDPLEKPDSNELITKYTEMCNVIENLHLPVEMRNVIYFTIRYGVFYGYIYEDDNSIFIHRLNPDYCKPVSIEAGVFNFAFDFSYFKKYPEALETWDPEFKTMYNAYERDNTNMRWQILSPEKTICMKARPDLDENIPLFVGIFEALLDLIDARTLQRNKDIIQNYKLIVQKIPYFEGGSAKDLDDFRLRLETVQKFAQQLLDSVPEAVGVATTPMEVDTIDFKPDDNSNDLISTSMKSVFDDSGVSQLLFNSHTTGSTGVDMSVKIDTSLAYSYAQYLELWVKRFISYRTSSVDFNFEILDVHIFNKDAAVDRELKLAQSGVPNKMKLAASSGMSPVEVISNQQWENEYLQIHMNWIPLQTSYTLSSDSGRPENGETDDVTVTDTNGTTKDSGEQPAEEPAETDEG